MQSKLVGKESSGSLLHPLLNFPTLQRSPPIWSGSEDNVKLENMGSTTGNLSSPSGRKLLWPPSPEYSRNVTPSFPEVPLQMNMSTSSTPLSPARSSTSESNPSAEILNLNGNQSGSPPNEEISMTFPPQYVFSLTAPSVLLERTIPSLLLLSALPSSSRAVLEVGSLIGRGMKRESKLILKTHGRSGGLVTKVKSMLSLMNFEELSTFPISSDGLTIIRSMWRLKAHVHRFLQTGSGSLLTSSPVSGTPNSTP